MSVLWLMVDLPQQAGTFLLILKVSDLDSYMCACICIGAHLPVCLSSAPSAPTDIVAAQDGPTSIRVSWTPPSLQGIMTSYRINYTSSNGSTDSVSISDISTGDYYLLSDLWNGERYRINFISETPYFRNEYFREVRLGIRSTARCAE